MYFERLIFTTFKLCLSAYCLCTCVQVPCRIQARILAGLELESQAAASCPAWVQELNPGSSHRSHLFSPNRKKTTLNTSERSLGE